VKGNKGHTSRWSIGRFWSWRLLDSSLKLHKVKFVTIRVILWSRKRKSYFNKDFLGGSFPLGSWKAQSGTGLFSCQQWHWRELGPLWHIWPSVEPKLGI
jgi:hypothetical protein